MAKDRNPEVTAALKDAIDKLDLDGVLYRLAEIAVERRDAAERPRKEGGNPGEAKYWQRAIGVLHEAVDRLGAD